MTFSDLKPNQVLKIYADHGRSRLYLVMGLTSSVVTLARLTGEQQTMTPTEFESYDFRLDVWRTCQRHDGKEFTLGKLED